MRRSIKELPHLWRYNLMKDYIQIDITDNLWEPTLKRLPSVFCKVLHYTDGTAYIKFRGDSWLIEE